MKPWVLRFKLSVAYRARPPANNKISQQHPRLALIYLGSISRRTALNEVRRAIGLSRRACGFGLPADATACAGDI